jgi:class 3 adenylate cyclase/predicted ATPase
MERKVATVLFVDLVDSTALVSGADPEVVRGRVNRYFREVSRRIETHGGTVEKFVGDAVMAAFGVPRAHEDDAERALRAALEIVPAVEALGLGLSVRIGVESGEVVVEDSESTFATGEAVNLAARLQQAAAPGEILLGPGARRLAADAVEVENRGPIEAKGRPEPVWTWRALRAHDTARGFHATPFVGREAELELLTNAYTRATRDRRAHLITVFGEPGVGKSRLVREFTDGVERATVLFGRALPYGEGVTYLPLASMVKQSAGITDGDPSSDAFDKLRVCCESEAVADLLAAALGVLGAADDGGSGKELAWAAKRWAEQLADAQPLVLVFEDVHWAEEQLLALIEDVARELRATPLLVVAVARPELLERCPAWGGGNPRALSLEVGPLAADEAADLAEALLVRSNVPLARRALLLEKAEGNPLFLEETARILTEEEGALERIPDTVQALIAARIDRLEADEKRLLQRAALVGRVFWRGALDRLAGEDVGSVLDRLLDRELILPEERSTLAGDRAFRFKHVLIRDVAYAGLSKTQRAEDHRAFAEWLGERARDELVELRAYHLDQAVERVAPRDGAGPRGRAHEAALALEEAGDRSLRRESFASARRLLLRANALEPSLRRRYLAARSAFRLSDFECARDELTALRADARRAGDRSTEGKALLTLAAMALHHDADEDRARALANEAMLVLDPADDRSQYEAHMILVSIGWWTGDLRSVEENALAMRDIARRMQRVELESRSVGELAHLQAERDPQEAMRLFGEALELAGRSESLEARANALVRRAQLEHEQGMSEQAKASAEESRALFQEIGGTAQVGWALATLGEIELETGDLGAAERSLREALRLLTSLRQRGNLVEAQRQLADVMLARGRIDEAERYVLAAEETVGHEDAWSRALTISTLALVRAAQGRNGEAESLMRRAVAIGEGTGYLSLKRRLRERRERLELGATARARP